MESKKYEAPEFKFYSVVLEDSLAISNPRDPIPEQGTTGVDEGDDF